MQKKKVINFSDKHKENSSSSGNMLAVALFIIGKCPHLLSGRVLKNTQKSHLSERKDTVLNINSLKVKVTPMNGTKSFKVADVKCT